MRLLRYLVAGLTLVGLYAHAQSPATNALAPAPATSLEATELQPMTPEMLAAAQKKLYAILRDQVEKGRASGSISKDQYLEMSKSWAKLSDQFLVAADDAARISSNLGDTKFVFGIMATYGAEYIFGMNGKILAAGPSVEVGAAGFVSNNFDLVFTGVILGGLALEQSLDVNLTQNRSQADRGWRVKVLFARKRVANISNFSGVFVGGGVDAKWSLKGYVGGCFNRNEFVHNDLFASEALFNSPEFYNRVWQAPYNYVREHLENCNSFIMSFSMGTNINVPPWSVVEKGLFIVFPASNRGLGYHVSDIWKGLRTGIWE